MKGIGFLLNQNDNYIMENRLNLKLRSEVLEIALQIEECVNQLLLIYLNIENVKLRALGKKSGSLSFKSKLDLMLDIQVLTNEDHAAFLLLMEFRNQFLHNIQSNSFESAILLLGEDRGKQLLKYCNIDFDNNLEDRYKNSYAQLYIKCLDIILSKYDQRRKYISEKKSVITVLNDNLSYIVDKDWELLSIIIDKCSQIEKDAPELLSFKFDIVNTIFEFSESALESEEFLEIKSRIKTLMDENKIKKLFR